MEKEEGGRKKGRTVAISSCAMRTKACSSSSSMGSSSSRPLFSSASGGGLVDGEETGTGVDGWRFLLRGFLGVALTEGAFDLDLVVGGMVM